MNILFSKDKEFFLFSKDKEFQIQWCAWFTLTLGLIRSSFAVFFGNLVWAWSIINIIIYGIGYIALFKDKPNWLLPSIVWLMFESIFSSICLILIGDFDDIFDRMKGMTTEEIHIKFIKLLVLYTAWFGWFLYQAFVVNDYYTLRLKQKTKNHQQKRNQQAERDFCISIVVESQCEKEEEKS